MPDSHRGSTLSSTTCSVLRPTAQSHQQTMPELGPGQSQQRNSSITCGVPRSTEQRNEQKTPGIGVQQSACRHTLIHNWQRTSINETKRQTDGARTWCSAVSAATHTHPYLAAYLNQWIRCQQMMPGLDVGQSSWRHTLIHNLRRTSINGAKRQTDDARTLCSAVTSAKHTHT